MAQEINTSENKKLNWVNVLIAVATFGVVQAHVNGYAYGRPAEFYWAFSSLIECGYYWTVPCFFMLSGYLLMDYRKRYDTKVFFEKRLLRVVVPYVFWTCFFLIYYRRYDFSYAILNNRLFFEYWFFLPLIMNYISIIFLSLLPEKLYYFKWLALWAFISSCLIPFLSDNDIIWFSGFLQATIASGYSIYVVLGYLLAKLSLSLKQRLAIYALGLCGFSFLYFGTHIVSTEYNHLNEMFKGFLNFPAVLWACAAFVWFRYQDWSFILKSKAVQFCIKIMVECSLGIYLFHPFAIKMIWGYVLHDDINSTASRLITPFFIVIIICCLMKLFAKILPEKLHYVFGYKKMQ